MTSSQLFISYEHDHLDEVVALTEELRARAVMTWQDIDDIRKGMKFEAEIRKGLADSNGCLWYVTDESLTSEWVRNLEVPLALKRESTFVKIPVFRSFGNYEAAKVATKESFGSDLTEFSAFMTDGSASSLATVANGALKTFFPKNGDSSDRSVISVAMNARSYGPSDADVVLDWYSILGREPGQTKTWERVWHAILDVSAALTAWSPCRSIVLSGKAHLTAGFAFGLAFPTVSGFRLTVDQGGEPWENSLQVPHTFELDTDWGDLNGDVLTIEVGTSRSVLSDASRYLEANNLSPRARLKIEPESEPSKDAISLATAGSLARDIAEEVNKIRAGVTPKRLLFFMACPLALSVFIGSQLNAAGAEVVSMEFDEGEYHEALLVPSGRAR